MALGWFRSEYANHLTRRGLKGHLLQHTRLRQVSERHTLQRQPSCQPPRDDGIGLVQIGICQPPAPARPQRTPPATHSPPAGIRTSHPPTPAVLSAAPGRWHWAGSDRNMPTTCPGAASKDTSCNTLASGRYPNVTPSNASRPVSRPGTMALGWFWTSKGVSSTSNTRRAAVKLCCTELAMVVILATCPLNCCSRPANTTSPPPKGIRPCTQSQPP